MTKSEIIKEWLEERWSTLESSVYDVFGLGKGLISVVVKPKNNSKIKFATIVIGSEGFISLDSESAWYYRQSGIHWDLAKKFIGVMDDSNYNQNYVMVVWSKTRRVYYRTRYWYSPPNTAPEYTLKRRVNALKEAGFEDAANFLEE